METDPRAVAEDVWLTLSDAMRAFIRSRVPSDSDADDILQIVFTTIIEKSGSLRAPERLESWVYQTTRNAVADFYRRRPPQSETPAEAAELPAPDETSVNCNHAVGAWLMAMSDKIPAKLREAVRLYELDGVSQAEIAERLQISHSGAKSRIQRGRRQLQELLKNCCELELDRRGNVLGCQASGPSTQGCCSDAACDCRG